MPKYDGHHILPYFLFSLLAHAKRNLLQITAQLEPGPLRSSSSKLCLAVRPHLAPANDHCFEYTRDCPTTAWLDIINKSTNSMYVICMHVH